jgi:hypothetical protein
VASSAAAIESAPDFFEPVVAWRVWRVFEYWGRCALVSLHREVSWPSAAPLTAYCKLRESGSRPRHVSPAEECDCGIYAIRLEEIEWESLSTFPWPYRPLAIGRVSLWGRVIEAELGWRAAYAYPERVFVPGRGWLGRRRARRIASKLGHYGVPVEVLELAEDEVVPRLLELSADDESREPNADALPPLTVGR